jgi:hypothetical protein
VCAPLATRCLADLCLPLRAAIAAVAADLSRTQRKCSFTNRLIHAKDHASVQISVAHVDEKGVCVCVCCNDDLSGRRRVTLARGIVFVAAHRRLVHWRVLELLVGRLLASPFRVRFDLACACRCELCLFRDVYFNRFIS